MTNPIMQALDEMQARCDAVVEEMDGGESAEFMAGVNDRIYLIKALEFVLDEHYPFTDKLWAPECLDRVCEHEDSGRIEDCPSTLVQLCSACSELAEMVDPYFAERNLDLVSYPCATVRAIAKALGVGDE